VVFALVVLAAGAIFDRSWEHLMSLEPSHGPARLSGPGRAMIGASAMRGYCYALLPDGRLWAGKTEPIRADRTLKNLSGHFVDGSNWVALASARLEGAVALKSDGTLWKLSNNAAPGQIGSDTGWKKVVAGPDLFLALKQDGTIWGWGDNESEILAQRQDKDERGRTFSDPVQVWPDSDWKDVFQPHFAKAIAVKRDGSLWNWGNRAMNGMGVGTNRPSGHQLVRMDIAGTNWSSMLDLADLGLGIGADGRLMLSVAAWNSGSGLEGAPSRLFGSPIPWGRLVRPVQLGGKSDWLDMTLGGIQVLALEADGTFWAIDRNTIEARQPSHYRDWLAVSGDTLTIWSLARDGTLVCWSDFSREIPFEELRHHWFVLRPSRRPLASLNILDSN
jgi:hypothetical protein